MTGALVKAVLVAASLMLAACEDPVEHATGSGRLEVALAARDIDAVKGRVVDMMPGGGFTLPSHSAHVLSDGT